MVTLGNIKAHVRGLLGRLVRLRDPLDEADFTAAEWSIIRKVRPYTLTSHERIVSLLRSVDYLHEQGIGGDIVECGVYKGGSIMAAVLQLMLRGDTQRDIHLYDTFEGMAQPGDADVDLHDVPAMDTFTQMRIDENSSNWARAGLTDVRNAVASTGYPIERFKFIKGRVEDTLPNILPDKIALLRLDTDWYESTHHELAHLYPRLVPGGILIIDDYGHYKGCEKAVDEFIAGLGYPLFLGRIDYTARIAVKPLATSRNHEGH